MPASFDYDETNAHERYDKGRSLPPETLRLWQEAIIGQLPREEVKTIIDLGCGTGRFSLLLSDAFSAKVYGIEPSEKMLSTARQNISSSLITFLKGSGEGIPLPANTADMIFLSMVFHHIEDKEKALFGFRKVLKDKGHVLIRTSTRQSMKTYFWPQFFPGAMEIEMKRAPDRAELTGFFKDRGFYLTRHLLVKQRFAKNHLEYFEKISTRTLSSLQAISDQEFQDGLARLKEYCLSRNTSLPVREEIDLFVFQLRYYPSGGD
ncbi:MAG: methyltransferase domain-containing protein [Deltaproteobacteria bacterium]|nr:methyltransferase domain-containing protein [Deltaproteobacteria bacterium]